MKKIEWQEIVKPAEKIFNIWVDTPEMQWAEFAWGILEKQGMTNYKNQLDKQKVLINLLALGCIYHDFCKEAFDETSHLEYQIDELLYSFEENDLYISTYLMGVILHSEEEFHDEEFVSKECEKELMGRLLFTAAHQSISVVAKALIKELDSTSALFLSLWNSNKNSDEHKVSHVDELNFMEVVTAYEYIETLES